MNYDEAAAYLKEDHMNKVRGNTWGDHEWLKWDSFHKCTVDESGHYYTDPIRWTNIDWVKVKTYDRPPLGLIPKRIWFENRAKDICCALARNINDVGKNKNHNHMIEWSKELCLILGELEKDLKND